MAAIVMFPVSAAYDSFWGAIKTFFHWGSGPEHMKDPRDIFVLYS